MTLQKSISPRAWFELLALAVIWGGSFLSNRVALAEVGVFTLVAFRVTGALVVLWAYVLLKRLAIPRSAPIWAALLLMGVLNNVIPFTLIVWGQQHIESGLASILNASTAVFGALFASLAFADERLTPTKAAGIALGFIGVATAIGLSTLSHLDLTSLGQLAVVASSISYAAAATFARKVLRGLPPQMLAAGMLTGSALTMLPLAGWIEGAPALTFSAPTWAALTYLSLIATALAYLLYYRVLAMAGAGNLLLVTLLVAPVAVLLGALVFQEAIGASGYIGFALLAAGLILIDGRILKPRSSPVA